MLRLTVEILPFGREDKARVLDTVDIVNTGDHIDRPDWGHYLIKWKGGKFKEYDHLRSRGFWPLIHRIASALYKEEKAIESG